MAGGNMAILQFYLTFSAVIWKSVPLPTGWPCLECTTACSKAVQASANSSGSTMGFDVLTPEKHLSSDVWRQRSLVVTPWARSRGPVYPSNPPYLMLKNKTQDAMRTLCNSGTGIALPAPQHVTWAKNSRDWPGLPSPSSKPPPDFFHYRSTCRSICFG